MPIAKPRLTLQILSLKYLNHMVKYWTKDFSKEKGSLEVKGRVIEVKLMFTTPVLKTSVEPYGELTIVGQDEKRHKRKHTEVVLDVDKQEEVKNNANQSTISTPQQARDGNNNGVKKRTHK